VEPSSLISKRLNFPEVGGVGVKTRPGRVHCLGLGLRLGLTLGLLATLCLGGQAAGQSLCGPGLIEANELLNKGHFAALQEKLEPCWSAAAPREEKVEAYRILILVSMATHRHDLARRQAEELLTLKPDYTVSFLDSPKFAKLLRRIRASWLDPSRQEVVTATKREQKIGEAPAVISLVTASQIDRYGYDSVGEALGAVSGLDLLSDHLQYNLGVRGINGGMRGWSRIVKVMIENQSVSFRPSSENFLGPELIPMQAIDRIEVVRGPSSALYGANAYLGVVNIIVRRGAHVDGIEVDTRVGIAQGHPAYEVGLLFGKKVGGVDYLVAANGGMADRSGLEVADLPGESRYGDRGFESRNDISRPASLFARAVYESAAAGRLALDLNVQQLDSFGEFQDWGVLTGQNRVNVRNGFVRARYDRTFGGRLGSSLSLALSRGGPTDQEFLTINQRGVGDWITRDVGYRAVDLAAEMTYAAEGGVFLALGLDHSRDAQDLQTYSRNYFDQDSQTTGFVQGDRTFVNSGIYLQGVFHPFRAGPVTALKRLGLTAGVRYDNHNIYGDITNWRFAGAYPFNEDWYAKVLYGTSFKAPSPSQLFTTLIVPQGVLGNPDLKPEKARTWEAALGGRLSRSLSLSLVGFVTQVRNNVELVPSGANTRADNVAKVSSFGFEEETFYRTELSTLYLNLSYQKSTKKRVDRLRGEIKDDTHLYPAFTAKFGGDRRLRRLPLTLGAEGRYISPRIASEQNIKNYDPINLDNYRLDPYLLLDMVATAQTLLAGRKTQIQVKIRNLADTRYFFPGFRDFDIPGLGRSFSAGLSYRF
jgi:outer membrane receptor for ferrienterochelin and colicins